MKTCQIIMAALLVLGFFVTLWSDFNGKKAREPFGFSGAVVTVIIYALLSWCYISAGAFSQILP